MTTERKSMSLTLRYNLARRFSLDTYVTHHQMAESGAWLTLVYTGTSGSFRGVVGQLQMATAGRVADR